MHHKILVKKDKCLCYLSDGSRCQREANFTALNVPNGVIYKCWSIQSGSYDRSVCKYHAGYLGKKGYEVQKYDPTP